METMMKTNEKHNLRIEKRCWNIVCQSFKVGYDILSTLETEVFDITVGEEKFSLRKNYDENIKNMGDAKRDAVKVAMRQVYALSINNYRKDDNHPEEFKNIINAIYRYARYNVPFPDYYNYSKSLADVYSLEETVKELEGLFEKICLEDLTEGERKEIENALFMFPELFLGVKSMEEVLDLCS